MSDNGNFAAAGILAASIEGLINKANQDDEVSVNALAMLLSFYAYKNHTEQEVGKFIEAIKQSLIAYTQMSYDAERKKSAAPAKPTKLH